MVDRFSILDLAAKLLPARYPARNSARYMGNLTVCLDRLLMPGESAPRSLAQFHIPLSFRATRTDTLTPAMASGKAMDIWDVLFRAPRLALIGEIGAGKTSTLKYVAVALAQEKMPQTYIRRLTFLHQGQACDQLLPIYANFAQLDLGSDDLATVLAEVLANYGFSQASNFLRAELTEGRCLLLLDDLDASSEAEHWSRLNQLLNKYPRTQTVLAARTADPIWSFPGMQRFESMPFSDREIRALIDRRLGKNSPAAHALLQAMERSSSLHSLGENPLLLAILAWTSEIAPATPLRLPDLYESCLRYLLTDETEQASSLIPSVTGENTHRVLQDMAYYFHQRHQGRFDEGELATAAAQARESTRGESGQDDSMISRIQGTGLLQRQDDKGYAFLRLGLQEFLTAQAVVRRNRFKEVLHEHVDDPWWHEVIVLATALQGNAEDVVQSILSGSTWSEHRLFLAARCAAEARSIPNEVREGLLAGLSEILEGEDSTLWPSAAVCVAALEKSTVSDHFTKKLRDGNVAERAHAALVLGRIGRPRWATVPLLGALDRSRPWQVRRTAAWALGELADRRAIPTLVETLKDEREEVASEAALALSAFGELAAPLLISSLSSDQPSVRQMAVKALGNMGYLAMGPLLDIAQDEQQPDHTVRGAAEALGLLGDQRAVAPLVALLRARNGRLAQSAAHALAAIGEPAVEPLIASLPTRSAELALRGAIVDALVDIGEPSIDPLIQSLDSPSSPVRNAAVEALTRIGPTAIAALVTALRTENWDLRRRIAQILGQIGEPSLVGPLIQLLRDDDAGVRVRAAQILGQIGQQQAVEPLIESLQHDPDEFVRRTAIKALAALRSTDSIESLIQRLDDAQLRDIAAISLSEIGEPAVEQLIRMVYENRNPETQQAAIKALDTIGASGRWEEETLRAVARAYSLLLTEKRTLDEVIALLSRVRWWKPGEEMHRSFVTAQELLQAHSLRDVAEYPEQLEWVESLEQPFRPAVKHIFQGLDQIVQNIRLYLQDSRRAGQRDAMLSALDTMTDIQEAVDTQLLPFERVPFAEVVLRWRALMEEALKSLRGRARLEIVALREDLPLDRTSSSSMIVFRLTNVGDSPARNLSVTLKQSGRDGFEVIGQSIQELYPLGTGMQQDVEFWIKPLSSNEAGYVFEVSYDDDEGTGHFHPTSGRVRFFVVGEEYRPIPTSPYVMGPPVKTRKMFYGRQDVFDWIEENISGSHQQNILVLHGERRMGKTSILYQLLNRPPTPQHVCVFFSLELAITNTLGDLLYDLAMAIYKEAVKLDLGLREPDERDFMEDPQRCVLQFFAQVEKSLGDRRLLIMIDEIDILIAKVEEGVLSHDVFNFLRGLMQHSDKIAFIVTGAYKVNEMLKDNRSILFNIARPFKISYLYESEAAALVVEPLAGDLTYDNMVVEKVIRVTACHPYFIQYICDSLVKLAQKMRKNFVYLPDIDVVLQEVIQDNTGVLQNSVYAPLSKPEQRVLASLANVTDERRVFVLPDAVAEVLDKHQLQVAKRQLLDALRSLRERDLAVEKRIGQNLQYGFKMDLIRMWLRQNEMLLRLSQEAKI
jgi:HEAT repeat protein